MYKIIIVDDDNFIRKGLKELINWDELGINVIEEAEGGHEALEKIIKLNPDIVLTDIRMTHGNGLELIEAIRKEGLNTRIIALSGYDEFDYVHKAMKYNIEDYLLKPVNEVELMSILKSSIEKIQNQWQRSQMQQESQKILLNNILNRWVDNWIEPKQLKEKLHFLNINLAEYKVFQIGVTSWEDIHDRNISSSEQNFRSFCILNILEEELNKNKKGFAFLKHNNQIIILFMGHHHNPETFTENNMRWVSNLTNRYKTRLNIPWFSTLGKVCIEPGNLHISYKDANQLLNYMHLANGSTCINSDYVHSPNAAQIPSMINREQLIPCILSGEKNLWTTLLENDFQWALKQDSQTAAAKTIAIEWIVTMRQSIRIINTDADYAFLETNLISQILEYDKVKDIHKGLYLLIENLQIIIHDHSNNPAHSVVYDIKKYINSNFNEELTLQILGEKFHVNSSYLGRLFKEKTGEYFNDYLCHVRITKAQNLLTESTLKISTISKKIGYSDPNYFLKKFKQIIGLTPSEYRNIQKNYDANHNQIGRSI